MPLGLTHFIQKKTTKVKVLKIEEINNLITSHRYSPQPEGSKTGGSSNKLHKGLRHNSRAKSCLDRRY